MKTRWYFFILLLSLSAIHAKDWNKVKKEYENTRKQIEDTVAPEYHFSRSGDKTWIFDNRPELGLNIHNIDDECIKQLKIAGIRFVRTTLYWYHFQKDSSSAGNYNTDQLKLFDQKLQKLTEAGLIPVIVVHGNPRGFSYSNHLEAYKQFADFMAFLAGRYKQVRYWQLWNEMDKAFTDIFGARHKDVSLMQRGKNYALMLSYAYPAIKKANPDALVVTGGMVETNDFPIGIYEGGGHDFFDIMAIHTYGMPLQWSFVSRGANVRRIMQEHADSLKPLWNTEFGVSCASQISAWGIPKENPGESFDNRQRDMLEDCIVFNKKGSLYDKYFIYAYAAPAELSKSKEKELDKVLGNGMTTQDYGYGLTRKDGKTARPSWEAIVKSQPNAGLEKEREVSYVLDYASGKVEGKINVSSAYPASVKTPVSKRLIIENGELKSEGKPFFPLGFVFGRNAKEVQRAKEVGMNSLHYEYSIRDVMPDSYDKVSEKGIEKIHYLHKLCADENVMFFPLLSGHYIPDWLRKTAGEKPHDADGKNIGLWFRHSMYNPVYRKTLEKFWKIVATEAGDDPNAGAFVSWNEPAYGLDYTPHAITAYQKWLEAKYADIADFNKEAGTDFKDFASVKPPVDPDNNRVYWYMWCCYNQQAFADFFALQRQVFKDIAPQASMTGKHPVSALTGDALYCIDQVLQAQTQDIYGFAFFIALCGCVSYVITGPFGLRLLAASKQLR